MEAILARLGRVRDLSLISIMNWPNSRFARLTTPRELIR
jgi:hypothetical protein